MLPESRSTLDELPQSAVLEDVGSDTGDIQQELDEAGSPPKWTRSSPRLSRDRPGLIGAAQASRAEARALQLALGTLRRLVAENIIRPGRVAVRHPASLAARSARRPGWDSWTPRPGISGLPDAAR